MYVYFSPITTIFYGRQFYSVDVVKKVKQRTQYLNSHNKN